MNEPQSRLRVQERFVSLQGEGTRVGVPSQFIRVAGCNLRCAWCDSPQSSWAPEGEFISVEELAHDCTAGPRDVVLTGGEPLLFPALATLSRKLRAQDQFITVETAGTVWLDDLECDLMSISPKLGHSTPEEGDDHALASPSRRAPRVWVQRHENRRWAPTVVRRLLDHYGNWQLKFVVRWRDPAHLAEDLREIEAMLGELKISSAQADRVLLMPECIDTDDLRQAYEGLRPQCERRGFRLGERLHIHIFGHQPGT